MTYATIEQAARALAQAKGWKGGRGGWIYEPAPKRNDPGFWRTVAQGYLGLGMRMQKRGLIVGTLSTGYRLAESQPAQRDDAADALADAAHQAAKDRASEPHRWPNG